MSLRLRRLWIQMTADKRRFGVLCAMLAIGLLLWARLIVVSNMPRTVVAAPKPEASADAPVAAKRKSTHTVEVALAAAPQRDPFVISRDYFPKPTVVPQVTQEVQKSGDQTVETPQALEARTHARLQELVDRMKLEAVMTGASMAAINGKVYRLGDSVPASPAADVRFLLKEVRERSVTLTLEHREFQLKIAAPGVD